MEFGNVYEVFELGDLVKINNVRNIHCGRTGTIIGISHTGPNDVCYYNVRLDPTVFDVGRDVKGFDIWVDARSLTHRFPEKTEIVMGLRSCKTLYQGLKKLQDEQAEDTVEYTKELLNKLIGGTDEMKNVDVKKIIFNGPKTIVLWTDGTKTIVSMSKDETNFDPEAAFCAAYTKKMFGTNSKIKRVIKEKSNIEQHQRIVEEKLKEELAKISQDYDKFMRELCPWLYTGEKLTEVDSACANAISDFYKKDDECLGKLCPCGDLENTKAEMEDEESSHSYPATEELAKIQDSNAKTLYETMLSLMRAINEDMEKNNGNN